MLRRPNSAFIVALIAAAGTPAAFAQDAPPAATTTTTNSAADLLKALQEAGVDLSSLTTVNDDGTVTVARPMTPQEVEAAAKEAEEATKAAEAAAAPKEEPAVKWDNKLTLGFGVSSGNTDRANVASVYVMTRETDRSKLTFDAAYFYAEDDGNKSENRFTTGLLHDWLFPNSRWLIFADVRYDYDEFQSWRHRLAFHVGPGYKLIDEDKIKLTLRAGIGAAKEWLSENDGWRPEALAGADFDWKISENQGFAATFRIFPDLDDFGEYRTRTTAGWKMDIDRADGLALTLGLLHEYQSVVDDGRDNDDLKIFGGLTFDF